MDLKTIKRIIQMVESAQISHLSLELEGVKIDVKKELTPSPSTYHTPSIIPSAIPATFPSPIAHPATNPSVSVPIEPPVSDGLLAIKSQMVGTFYASQKPEAPPFVRVGDSIKPGQVLCVVEAMKLFNEIESEFSGVIEKICVENGTPIEYGQELFLIRTH